MISIRSSEDLVSRAARNNRSLPSTRHYLHQVQIVFGARNRNCAGSGICSAKELLSKEAPAISGCGGCNTAIARVRILGQKLVFTFPALCPRLVQQYFNEDIFRVECDATLALRVFGQQVQYDIPQGAYRVFRRKGALVVPIPMAAGAAKSNVQFNNLD